MKTEVLEKRKIRPWRSISYPSTELIFKQSSARQASLNLLLKYDLAFPKNQQNKLKHSIELQIVFNTLNLSKFISLYYIVHSYSDEVNRDCIYKALYTWHYLCPWFVITFTFGFTFIFTSVLYNDCPNMIHEEIISDIIDVPC